MKLIKIKASSPYINGVVGRDIRLPFWQRIKILFSSGISVVLISTSLFRSSDEPTAEYLLDSVFGGNGKDGLEDTDNV